MDRLHVPDAEDERVMPVSLAVGGGALRASDIMPSTGHRPTIGNHHYVSIHRDTREEADHLVAALSKGGEVEMPLMDAPWDDHFGSFRDRRRVSGMINHHPRS